MPHYSPGFTFLELLVALAILALVSTLALPAAQTIFLGAQATLERDQLLGLLGQARAQSILTGEPHQLCGSIDGEQCDSDWSQFWLLKNEAGDVIRRHRLAGALQLCWRGISSQIRYNPDGTTLMGNGRFVLCRQSEVLWQLVVNRQGRIRDDSGTDGNCCQRYA